MGRRSLASTVARNFKFNEAISFQVNSPDPGRGRPFLGPFVRWRAAEAQQCGWLKDKFGVSWQIVPVAMMEMLKDPDTTKSQRAMAAMMQMKKLDIAELQRAFNGES